MHGLELILLQIVVFFAAYGVFSFLSDWRRAR